MATQTQTPSKWDRSDNYRSTFLKINKGLFGKFYICCYCGKLITRKNMQVDHMLAINHVKHNPLLKLVFGICNFGTNMFNRVFHRDRPMNHGVNVTYNLVPACAKCNNKKSDKAGIWAIRGLIFGTIWKAINGINNLIRTLFTTPIGIALVAVGVVCCFAFIPELGAFVQTNIPAVAEFFSSIGG